MHDFFQIGYLFAIGGGVIGSVWSSMKDHDAPVSSLFEALISAVAAASVAERFLMLNQVWTCAIAGAFVGILTGHAMDTVQAIAPGLMKKWLRKTADKFIDSKD
ncbi:hypothetical protein O3683_05685 [Neisseria flavescens]|uniref:hypothetical protein n=1 Tax=Neisseria TaxID=482 RepID=UPI0008A9A3F4|nr:hypothetical protein [Neisseria sp. HMSC064D07]OHQ05601.1 hypothetical protein HMPREF2608_10650 [Neisseria sp. HMSC064D07]